MIDQSPMDDGIAAHAAPLPLNAGLEPALLRMIEQSSVAIMLADRDGNIVYVNQRFSSITGYAIDEVRGCNPRLLQSGSTPRQTYQEMWLKLGAGQSWEGKILNRRKGGDHYWSFQTIYPLRDRAGGFDGYVSMSNDHTESHESYLSLQKMAFFDSLCEIANRRALHNHLQSLLSCADPLGKRRIALVLIDIDSFKSINDGYGHQAGDRVLKTVAERIAGSDYLKGFLARLGGDEFALVLSGEWDDEAIGHYLDHLLTAVARPIAADEYQISVSASVGVAFYPEHGHSVRQLMKCADTAMYRAKQAGRNGYVLFDAQMLGEVDLRVYDRNALVQALEQGQLLAVYQPVITCVRPGVAYHEALVRWRHPELGLLSPAVFLPAFQQFGLLCQLNDWMLQRVAATIAAGGGDGCVAINITASDLMQRDYATRCLAVLARHGLSPSALRLEITEGELIENFATCQRTIGRLREEGVRLYIDDFGVGYASLSYLRRLPVDGIKLDRSFLQGFPEEAQAVDIVASIIALAHRLGREVIAEGVEYMGQARQLTELGCDGLQGYLFGRPAPKRRQSPVKR